MTNTTPNLGIPLPSPINDLATDVLRIREALLTIDVYLKTFSDLLESDDVSLDTLQEVIQKIKMIGDDMNVLSQQISDQVQEEIMGYSKRIKRLETNQLLGLGI